MSNYHVIDSQDTQPLAVGMSLTCKMTGKVHTITSMRGSWVGLFSDKTKRTFFLPAGKVREAYKVEE